MKKPDASAFRLISMARNTHEFQTIRSEGGLLPPDLPRRVVNPKANLPGAKPDDHGPATGERINEAITQSWTACAATGPSSAPRPGICPRTNRALA